MLRHFAALQAAESAALLQDWLQQEPERRERWRQLRDAQPATPADAHAWLQSVAADNSWKRIAAASPAGLPPWADQELEQSQADLVARAWAVDLVAASFGKWLVGAGQGRSWGVPTQDAAVPDGDHRWAVMSADHRAAGDALVVAVGAVSKAGRVPRDVLSPALEFWDGILRATEHDSASGVRARRRRRELEWSRNGGSGHWQVSVPNEAAHLEEDRVRALVAWFESRPEVLQAYGEDRDRINLHVKEPARDLRASAEKHWLATATGHRE